MNLKNNVKASSFCVLISFSLLSIFIESCDGTSSKNGPNQINNGDVTAANTLSITRPSGSCGSNFCFYKEIKNKNETITVSPSTGAVSSFAVQSTDPSISVDTSQCGTTKPISITAAKPCTLIVTHKEVQPLKLNTINTVTLNYTYTNNLGKPILTSVDYNYEFKSVFSSATESTSLSTDSKFWTKNSHGQIVTQNSNGISVYEEGAATSPTFTNNTLSFFGVSQSSLYGATFNSSTISSYDLKTGTESSLAKMPDYLFNTVATYSDTASGKDFVYALAKNTKENSISLCAFNSFQAGALCVPTKNTSILSEMSLIASKNQVIIASNKDQLGTIYFATYSQSSDGLSFTETVLPTTIKGTLPPYATGNSMAYDEKTGTLFIVSLNDSNVYSLSAINSSGNISSYAFAPGKIISKPFLTQNGSLIVLNSKGTVSVFSKNAQGEFNLTNLSDSFSITGFTGSFNPTLLTSNNNQLFIPVSSSSEVISFNLNW